MKTFCPNCEKESECTFAAELYECEECGEDFAKYIVGRPSGSLNSDTSEIFMDGDILLLETIDQKNKLASFLRKIIKMGWLEGSDALTEEAKNILNDIKPLEFDGSDT